MTWVDGGCVNGSSLPPCKTACTHILNSFEAVVNDQLHVSKQLLCCLGASCGLDVEAQLGDGPLATVHVVVASSVLLNGHIGEVHHRVCELGSLVRVCVTIPTGVSQ